MAGNHVKLGEYAATFAVYQQKIKNSLDFAAALAHATDFLSNVACLFDKDMAKPFYDEVEYLWAAFPPHLKTLAKYQELIEVLLGQAMVGLINQLSVEAARQNGSGESFRVLVNSVLRTVEYQNSLANIGYVAPRHSAHLAGYAVDVEQQWYKEHDQQVHRVIEGLLGELYEKQVINLIQEGTHWHVCLNPDHIPHYEELAQNWERKNRLACVAS